MKGFVWRALVTVMVLAPAGMRSYAQKDCPLPPVIQPIGRDKNMFSDKQEIELGDVMAESVAHDIQIVHDEALNRHLQELGDQLARYLPPNQLNFRFILIDIPEVNAVSFAGGRIYVSRKLVALTQTDDELAGVLAHEMGHAVTHQLAIRYTRIFREVLGANDVGDQADIASKYHRFLETWRAKNVSLPREDEAHQYAADQVGLFAMARAGFAPHAYVDLWDRFEQTHGKTGSWFSDLFGATKPEQRRLREMLKSVSAMPSSCAAIAPRERSAEFVKWREAVIATRNEKMQASLPGLLSQQHLALPLRPEINHLRFSPDGQYVLAQDDGGIHVLSRHPFAVLFYIEAPDAHEAFFSPDSSSVIFYDHSLRVERWGIADKKLLEAHEMTLHRQCVQTALSPDGKILVCLDTEFTLSLHDVAGNNQLFSKQSFVRIYNYNFLLLLELVSALSESKEIHLAHIGFSPDGRFLLAGSRSDTLVFDLNLKQEAPLPGSIRNLMRDEFAFAGDKIIGVNPSAPQKCPVLRFPGGEKVGELALRPDATLKPASHGDSVLIAPLAEYPLGVLDITNGKVFAAFKQPAADIYDKAVLSEQRDGEIALTDLTTQKDETVALSQASLGKPRAIAVSDDLTWLAVSGRNRGAVWDLGRNIRVAHVRGFRGGWFDHDHSAYIDFPKYEKTERSIVRLDTFGNTSIVAQVEKGRIFQMGSYLIAEECARELLLQRKDCTLKATDFSGKNIIWSRHFDHEAPVLLAESSGTLVLYWPASASAVHDELRQFPRLPKPDRDDYLVEVWDLKKKDAGGSLIVKTNKNSFDIKYALSAADWVLVGAGKDRVLTYSLKTGDEVGHVFGAEPALSDSTRLYALNVSKNEVDVYDLATSQIRTRYTFPSSVSFKKFSADGQRLFVLTSDQTAYVLDLSAAQAVAKNAAN